MSVNIHNASAPRPCGTTICFKCSCKCHNYRQKKNNFFCLLFFFFFYFSLLWMFYNNRLDKYKVSARWGKTTAITCNELYLSVQQERKSTLISVRNKSCQFPVFGFWQPKCWCKTNKQTNKRLKENWREKLIILCVLQKRNIHHNSHLISPHR